MNKTHTEVFCKNCGGFIGEPMKVYGYAGKWCHCLNPQQQENPMKATKELPHTDAQKCCKSLHTSLAMICGCPCHTPHTPSSDWESDFMDFYMERGKYKGRPLGPEQYIAFIHTHIEKAVREEMERIQSVLKGHIMSAVDFAMYCAIGNRFDVDQREKYAREIEEKLITLTNKE